MKTMMQTRLLPLLLTISLILTCPVYAAARSDAWGDDYQPVEQQAETSYTSTTIPAGNRKDLNNLISKRNGDSEDYNFWELVGSVKWASSNPDIISVDQKGMATAHRVGSSTVTFTGWDNAGQRRVQIITVSGKSAGASGDAVTAKDSFTASEGAWINLGILAEPQSGGQSLTWSSSIDGVAKVDDTGLVRLRSAGRCTITAAYTDGAGEDQKIRYAIRVLSAVLADAAGEIKLTLGKGDTVDLGALLYPKYQSFRGFSATADKAGILDVQSLSVTGSSRGSTAVTLTGQDEAVLCKLTITVV